MELIDYGIKNICNAKTFPRLGATIYEKAYSWIAAKPP